VRVERLPAASPLRPPAARDAAFPYQDDYPALRVDGQTGRQYLAWVCYQKEKNRVLLSWRDSPQGSWSEPLEVAPPGDHFRVALAMAAERLWIVWSSQQEHHWDLYARPLANGRLGPEERLTESPGPALWHRMTSDARGRAWLVWQGGEDGRFTIFARCADADGWHEALRVSNAPGNHWDPTVTADPQADRVWVGWDRYQAEQATYGVEVRSLSGGPWPRLGEVLAPEPSPRFAAHVSLACDGAGRLWAAWDSSGPQWGKDTGFLYAASPATRLYASRQVRVKCLVAGRWQEPAAKLAHALPAALQEFNELPQLEVDGAGRVWLAFRYRTCRHPRVDGWAIQGRWDVAATAYLGDRWLTPLPLPDSGGRNDARMAAHHDRDGRVYFAYATDHRAWALPNMPPGNQSIVACRLEQAPPASAPRFTASEPAPAAGDLVHPREAEQIARLRHYRIAVGGKTYRIYRGDLHRHTDISIDGIGDGSLMDLHRYALDAAGLDFVLVTDHNMGQDNEYCWWRTQQANDLYSLPGRFLSLYGYERSVPYPNGHRNVIWLDRGHRTLPVPFRANRAQMAADTSRLYAYLRRTNGICTLHTSATDQGTNWVEHDEALEPFVELFQGYHTSYEAPAAPKTTGADTDQVHGPYKEDGFVSHALEKGYRLGFQASSDHVSTHVSYACILAEEFSRKGLVEAMRRRHTYAATDNIVLDVRLAGRGIMGDEVRTGQPVLEIVVLGTGPIDRVEVLRNGEVVHTLTPA
jgi:hypothetical protein